MVRSIVLAASVAAASFTSQSLAQEGPTLTEVAKFPHQVTGVTVSEDGRIFVNFPRWTEDVPVSVAEVVDGQIRPYPDDQWNAWRNAKKNEMTAGEHFVSVQSVVADGRGSLWVLDPAAPATAAVVPDGPKLVKIDLATNSVTQTIAFDESVAPQGSYLNDVRFSPDGSHAYITDSGPIGALVVVDLASGSARRLLEDHATTKADPQVVVTYEGKPLRRTDGRGVEFSADSIELSNDGETLYWKPLTGRTLFSIATDVIDDPNSSEGAIAQAVKRGPEVGVTDGLWIDDEDRLYLSALEEDAVKTLDGQTVETLIQDERLRWPDTFSQGPDGKMYVTASRIMDMNWYKPESSSALETTLWSFTPPSGDATGAISR